MCQYSAAALSMEMIRNYDCGKLQKNQMQIATMRLKSAGKVTIFNVFITAHANNH